MRLRKKRDTCARCAVSAVALTCSIAPAAHAQEVILPSAQSTESTPVRIPDQRGLDIVVTARKRSEFARDIPISISTVSGATLEEKNIARLTDLVSVVPNFSVSLSANQPLTFVRGFGSGGSPVFEQAVGKFVDNVSFGRDIDARLPLFDLERIEILKGPQVLLYGNSATAGALNITTRKPGKVFTSDGSASYEFENQEAILQAGVTVPLADKVSMRVAGFYQNLDRGWIRNTGNGRDEPTYVNYAIRPTLRLTPNDATSLTFKFEYDHLRDRGALSQPIRQASTPSRSFNEIELDDRRESNYNVAPFFMKESNATNALLYQADATYDTRIGTLTSTTAIRRLKNVGIQGNGSQRPSAIVINGQRFRQFSQELRLSGTSGSLDYLAGIYYERDKQALYAMTQINPGALGLPLPAFSSYRSFDGIANNYSQFFDLTYHVTPELSISGGARYSQIRKTADQLAAATPIVPRVDFDTPRSELTARINPALNPLFTAVFGGIAHSFEDIKTSENHFQPQIIAQYKFSPVDMVYAKFVKGDKSGGVDFAYQGSVARGANVEDSKFQPERATSFEVGVKGLALERRLEYSLTAFSMKFTDLQTSIFVGTALFVANAGKARSNGIELGLNWNAARGLRLSANANWQDAKYDDYSGAACDVQGTLPIAPAGGCDLSGQPLPFQSRWSGSVGVEYERSIGRGLVLAGGASALAKTRYYTALNNDPLGVQKGFVTLDAHLDLQKEDGSWTVSLFGRNLTDVNYQEYSVATPLIPGGYNVWLSRGRQLGLRLGFKTR